MASLHILHLATKPDEIAFPPSMLLEYLNFLGVNSYTLYNIPVARIGYANTKTVAIFYDIHYSSCFV